MKLGSRILMKVVSLAVLVFIPIRFLLAQESFQNPLKFTTLAQFLNALLDVIIIIGIPIVTLAIIYAGFLFISAQGNETKISSAKQIFFWVVIGSLLILGAKALAVAIEGTVKDLTDAPKSRVLTLGENPEMYGLIKGLL